MSPAKGGLAAFAADRSQAAVEGHCHRQRPARYWSSIPKGRKHWAWQFRPRCLPARTTSLNEWGEMSANGPKRTSQLRRAMSAFGGKEDIGFRRIQRGAR